MRALLLTAALSFSLGCAITVTGGDGGSSQTGGGQRADRAPSDGGASPETTNASATGSGGAGGSSACPPDACDGVAPPICGGGGSGPGYCYVDPHSCTCTCSCDGTPLVLVFDGSPVTYRVDAEHGFTLVAGTSTVLDWPEARTPWLAMDRDGDGRIGDGAELFGSMTRLAGGVLARDGFEALRELDANGDGRLDARDPAFARLLVWADADGDRASSAAELRPASAVLEWIDLYAERSPRCDARGNCEIERAPFGYRDAFGAARLGWVVDVHLRAQR